MGTNNKRPSQFEDLREVLDAHWTNYGGWWDFLRSPYLWMAVLLTLALVPMWTSPKWWDTVLRILPSLLGFSLGGYAILMAFGNDLFQRILAKTTKRGTTPYMDLSASFVHFILMQFSAIIAAVLASGLWEPEVPLRCRAGAMLQYIGWAIGFFLFSYSMMCGVAATMRIFRLSRSFVRVLDRHQKQQEQENEKQSASCYGLKDHQKSQEGEEPSKN